MKPEKKPHPTSKVTFDALVERVLRRVLNGAPPVGAWAFFEKLAERAKGR